ncbi:MAG: ribosome silencing factor [Chloroflexi bacterium]|nr:MAG: ribosome silencing factor [Chloroflexota bacterium]
MAEHVNGKAPGARKPAAKRPAAKRPPGKRAAAKPAVKPAVVKRVPKLKPVLPAASKPAPELELARAAVRVIEDKLGEDILLLDLQGISSFTDYFVIASAKGERQLKAIANAVLDVAKAKRRNVAHNLDAQSAGGWVLLDLGDVIVHLFAPEPRDSLNLEELWADGRVLLRVQ